MRSCLQIAAKPACTACKLPVTCTSRPHYHNEQDTNSDWMVEQGRSVHGLQIAQHLHITPYDKNRIGESNHPMIQHAC